jgi:hypothetical protein
MPAHVEDSKLLGERLGWLRIAISEGRVSDKITLCQLKPFFFTDLPNAIKNMTLLPAACGEKKSVMSSLGEPEAPRPGEAGGRVFRP